jgi:lipoprotein-releasing system ATP-binding protein
MNNILELIDVRRKFVQGDVTIEVLRGVDLSIAKGELVALLGPSGSGKSTMLQAVGLLEGGFSGSIKLDGEEVSAASDAEPTTSEMTSRWRVVPSRRTPCVGAATQQE